METLGQLIDKQSILMIRRACARDEETKKILDRMINKGRDHINQFYYEVVSGVIVEQDMIVQPKLKNYANQISSSSIDTKLGEAIQHLMEANIKLWELEDERRDISMGDSIRLAAADQVSVYNAKRNNHIDQIDQILWEQRNTKTDSSTKTSTPSKTQFFGTEQLIHGERNN